MTTTEMVANAKSRLAHKDGWAYDEEALATKIERGLEIGDSVTIEGATTIYDGDKMVRVVRGDEELFAGAVTDAHMDKLLLAVSMHDARV